MMRTFRKQPQKRNGFLYIAVLGTSILVLTIGLTSARVSTLYLKGAEDGSQRHDARILSASAIEHAIATLRADSDWETTYTVGTLYPTTAVEAGTGTFQWKLVDGSGGEKLLQGIGKVGDAVAVTQVTLSTGGNNYLDCPIAAGGDLVLSASNSTLTLSGGPAATNAALSNAGTITGDVEAQSASGNNPSGTLTAPATMRDRPDPEKIIQYYQQRGVSISPNGNLISQRLLSPASNPWNIFNPDHEGIYVVDAGGNDLTIEESRIVGTLVVVNAGQVKVIKSNNWEPAYENYPSLIVEGNLLIQLSDSTLDEPAVSKNFNPPFNPYQGNTDFSQDDSYPSALAGVVYCTGDMTFAKDGTSSKISIEGVFLAGGKITIGADIEVVAKHDAAAKNTPPPGMTNPGNVVIQRGSWRRVDSP